VEEGKIQGGLATSHQYGNALLGVCYQVEENILDFDKPLYNQENVMLRRFNEHFQPLYNQENILLRRNYPSVF